MAWYWWLAILVGVVIIAWIKLKVFGLWMKKRSQESNSEDGDE